MAKPIPDGHHAVTPNMTFRNSKKAIDFYKKAFGAKELGVFPNLNGEGIMHAEIQINDSILMMGDEMPQKEASKSAETIGGSPMSLFLYVKDADAVFKQAVDAGGTVVMPVEDMFWGDRVGTIQDPFGYQWMIATHKKDLSQDEIKAGAETFFAQFEKK